MKILGFECRKIYHDKIFKKSKINMQNVTNMIYIALITTFLMPRNRLDFFSHFARINARQNKNIQSHDKNIESPNTALVLFA